jgi:hypothetical protein
MSANNIIKIIEVKPDEFIVRNVDVEAEQDDSYVGSYHIHTLKEAIVMAQQMESEYGLSFEFLDN